jgi:hypothetical protein
MPTTVDDRVRELTGRAELGGAIGQLRRLKQAADLRCTILCYVWSVRPAARGGSWAAGLKKAQSIQNRLNSTLAEQIAASTARICFHTVHVTNFPIGRFPPYLD